MWPTFSDVAVMDSQPIHTENEKYHKKWHDNVKMVSLNESANLG